MDIVAMQSYICVSSFQYFKIELFSFILQSLQMFTFEYGAYDCVHYINMLVDVG